MKRTTFQKAIKIGSLLLMAISPASQAFDTSSFLTCHSNVAPYSHGDKNIGKTPAALIRLDEINFKYHRNQGCAGVSADPLFTLILTADEIFFTYPFEFLNPNSEDSLSCKNARPTLYSLDDLNGRISYHAKTPSGLDFYFGEIPNLAILHDGQKGTNLAGGSGHFDAYLSDFNPANVTFTRELGVVSLKTDEGKRLLRSAWLRYGSQSKYNPSDLNDLNQIIWNHLAWVIRSVSISVADSGFANIFEFRNGRVQTKAEFAEIGEILRRSEGEQETLRRMKDAEPMSTQKRTTFEFSEVIDKQLAANAFEALESCKSISFLASPEGRGEQSPIGVYANDMQINIGNMIGSKTKSEFLENLKRADRTDTGVVNQERIDKIDSDIKLLRQQLNSAIKGEKNE